MSVSILKMFKKSHHLASLSIYVNDSNRNHDKTAHIKIASLMLQPEIHEYQENSTSLCMEYILGKEQEGFFIFFLACLGLVLVLVTWRLGRRTDL